MTAPRDTEKFLKIMDEFPEPQNGQTVISQMTNLKQQLLGGGDNKANIFMVGPVVNMDIRVDEFESVLRLLKAVGQPDIADPQLGVREALTRVLEILPEPRMENLKGLARSIASEICDDNRTNAAKYLGVSVRSLRNHRDADSRVKEIEDDT